MNYPPEEYQRYISRRRKIWPIILGAVLCIPFSVFMLGGFIVALVSAPAVIIAIAIFVMFIAGVYFLMEHPR